MKKFSPFFDSLKTELLSINKNLCFTEDGTEDDSDEQFFYINFDDTYSLYVFCDDCGDGLGIHCASLQYSTIYYASDVGIAETDWDLFVLNFLKSVYGGTSVFYFDSDEKVSIDWCAYKNPAESIDFELFSLKELNEK